MGWLIMSEEAMRVNRPCGICHKPVMAGQRFYFRNKADVVHAHCLWEEEEKKTEKVTP